MQDHGKKHVIMVAMIEGYGKPIPDNAEVWVVNSAFRKQTKGVSRVYFFDQVKYFTPDFVAALNAMPRDVRLISSHHQPAVPRSEAYPVDEIATALGGRRYWVCSVAYMLAQAIYEGYDKITLAGMYYGADSAEYMQHKSCMEFWLGVAVGRGIELDIDKKIELCKPYPWEPEDYGFRVNKYRALPIQTLAAGYRACCKYPVEFVDHVQANEPIALSVGVA